jgi:hypothetical protein
MYKLCSSHWAISHVALVHRRWSIECRYVGWSWIVGERVPVRVLKSPHTMERCWGGMMVRMSSMSLRASASCICLFFSDRSGGR